MLGVAVEAAGLEYFKVEIAGADEDRAGACVSRVTGKMVTCKRSTRPAAIRDQFSERLAWERIGTSDSCLSRVTMSTASPETIVASGQPRVTCKVEEITVIGRARSPRSVGG